MSKNIIKQIVESLPYSMQEKAKRSYERFKADKRVKLSPEVVERLYFQVLNEARHRGK